MRYALLALCLAASTASSACLGYERTSTVGPSATGVVGAPWKLDVVEPRTIVQRLFGLQVERDAADRQHRERHVQRDLHRRSESVGHCQRNAVGIDRDLERASDRVGARIAVVPNRADRHGRTGRRLDPRALLGRHVPRESERRRGSQEELTALPTPQEPLTAEGRRDRREIQLCWLCVLCALRGEMLLAAGNKQRNSERAGFVTPAGRLTSPRRTRTTDARA